MASKVLVLDRDDRDRQELCRRLHQEQYAVTVAADFDELETLLDQVGQAALLIDLDSVPMTAATIRRLRRRAPELRLILLSSRLFHPELAPAMGSDVYACLRKPVDSEELFYWLRTVCKGGFSSRDSPKATDPSR